MFKNILVPTDGSTLSDSTVARAVSFASEAGARVTFFYAQPDFPMPIYGEGALIDPTTPEQFSRAAALEAERILAKARAVADAAGVSSSVDTQVSEVPYEAIIEAVERNQCDLIFMASHGRRGLSGLLLGSETQKVLTPSKTPVLVYRCACRVRRNKMASLLRGHFVSTCHHTLRRRHFSSRMRSD